MDTNHNKNKNTSKRHKKHKYTKDLQRDISNDEDTKLPEIDKKKKDSSICMQWVGKNKCMQNITEDTKPRESSTHLPKQI